MSLAIIDRKKLPRPLKIGLASVASVLICASIAGVSGLLSSSYSQRAIDQQATTRQSAIINASTVADIRRQLDSADAQRTQSAAV